MSDSFLPDSESASADQGRRADVPQGEPDPRFRLNPNRWPVRLDLTLAPELEERLRELAIRSGRDIEDLIVELLDRHIAPGRNRGRDS